MVLVVEGGNPKLRNGIVGETPEPWQRADGKAIAASAKKRELPDSLKDIEGPTTKGPYLTRLARVAEDVGAKAAVAVLVSTKSKGRVAHVIVVAPTGSVKADKDVPLGAPADDATAIVKAFSTELAALAAVEDAPPKTEPTPPAPGKEPATPPDGAGSSEPPKKDGSTASAAGSASTGEAANAIKPVDNGPEPPPLLFATFAVELANRKLTYRDAVTRTLRGDDSAIAPTPAISADFYPGARTGTTVLQDIGVFGDFKIGLVQDKAVSEGRSAGVTWTRFDVGLKYRIYIGAREWKSPMIAPSFSYGREAYSFAKLDPPPEPLDTPAANYETLRPRVDGRLPLGPIAIQGGAAFLALLSSGEIAGKFRDSSVIGWEADLGLVIPLPFIGKPFEARLGFAYRRFIYFFSPQTGDPYIANGANDQIMRGDIGFSAHL